MSKKKKATPEINETREETAVEDLEQQTRDSSVAPEQDSQEPEKTPEELAREEAQLWKDKYVRQLAEFDNFRKRTRQDTGQIGQAVKEAMIVSLLPVKDDFDRMFASGLDADETFLKGVELIYNKLNGFFETHSVKKMDGRGSQFDPAKHDALMMQPTKDFPPGTILEVITPGYMMGGRVIRHAQVTVSAEPETDAQDETDSQSNDNKDEA